MIIHCEKCDTKYRLDSSMISTSAVKVQCSKCSHIFVVPSVKDNNGITDLETGAPAAPPSPAAPSYENFDLSPGSETPEETREEAKEEVKTEPEAEAGPEAEEEPAPSKKPFDMPFSAPQEEPLKETEAEAEVEKAPDSGGPESDFEVESYIAGSNKQPLGEAEKEKEDAVIEEEKAEKPSDTKPFHDFDLGFSKPEETSESDGEAEAEDNDTSETTGAEAEDGDAKAKAEVEGEAEGEKTSEPEDSGKSEEEGRAEEASAHTFEATFNKPDETPIGDGEVSREFIAPDAATGEPPEPMAKYYVETPSSRAEEEPDAPKEPARAKEEKKESSPAKTEPEKDASFVEELLKAEKAETKKETKKEKEKKTEKKAAPKYDKNLVIPSTPTGDSAKKPGAAGIIAVIVIILAIAGGIIYFKTQSQGPLMALPSGEQTIEIESVKGYYVLNRDSGRIFVIESMIKNITDGPVNISAIRGVVLDSSGQEMESKMVSPGRVVGAKDLRTQPVDRLLRSFSDKSESTIPKKAVIPTMILFPDLNDAVAEYGIDVLR